MVGTVLDAGSVSQFVTLPGLWGPPISAIAVVWATGRSVRSFLTRRLRPTGAVRWYAVAFIGPVILGSIAPLVQGLRQDLPLEMSLMTPLLTFVFALFAGGLEEIGLRGFAHARLRDRYGTFWTGILIGIPWAVWHLPLQGLGVGFDGSFFWFAGAATGLSVLFGWLYDRLNASVLPVLIAHAAFDMPNVLTPVSSGSAEVETLSRVVPMAVYWGLAAGVWAAGEGDLWARGSS